MAFQLSAHSSRQEQIGEGQRDFMGARNLLKAVI